MCPPPRHTLSRRLPTTTRSPRHRPRRVEPPLGGSMRPCAAPGLRGHTAWLGGVAAWFDGGFPWVQSRRALHAFRVADGRAGDPAPSTVWCAGHACACGHHARIRLRDGRGCWWRVSTPRACLHCSSVDGKRLTDHALAACRRRALAVHWSASSGVLAELRGQNKRAHLRHRREPGGGLGAC